MELSHQQIAATILNESKLARSSLVPQGIKQKLGPVAFSEALRLHWLESDFETGYLKVPQLMSILTTIRKAAAGSPILESTAAKATFSPHRGIALDHFLGESKRQSVDTIMAEAYVPPPAPVITKPGPNEGWRKFILHQGRVPMQEAEAQPAKVGDQVVVAQDGQSFPGVVQTIKPDGKVVVSFGQKKPSQARDYDKAEVQVIAPAQSQQPQAKPQPTQVPAVPTNTQQAAAAPGGSSLVPGVGRV